MNSTGAVALHLVIHNQLQIFLRGDEHRLAQEQPTALCFAAIQSGLQDGQHTPCLHCASFAFIHFVAFVQSFPQHTHTAMLSVYQVTSDFPDDEIKLYDRLSLVLDHPWS